MTMKQIFVREGHEENHKNSVVDSAHAGRCDFLVTPVFAFLYVSSRPSRTKKGVE
jgi:hypothetical protein